MGSQHLQMKMGGDHKDIRRSRNKSPFAVSSSLHFWGPIAFQLYGGKYLLETVHKIFIRNDYNYYKRVITKKKSVIESGAMVFAF